MIDWKRRIIRIEIIDWKRKFKEEKELIERGKLKKLNF
jgi:hypothetical protein